MIQRGGSVSKKLTSQRTLSWQWAHALELRRIGKNLTWLRWTVLAFGVAYVLNAIAGRVWP